MIGSMADSFEKFLLEIKLPRCLSENTKFVQCPKLIARFLKLPGGPEYLEYTVSLIHFDTRAQQSYRKMEFLPLAYEIIRLIQFNRNLILR